MRATPMKRRPASAPIYTWGIRHKGKPMFVLGNGPSLANLPLGELDPYVTVGCNRVLRLYDPTYWIYADPYTLDPGVPNNVSDAARNSKAICLTTRRYLPQAEAHGLETHEIRFAPNRPGEPPHCGLSTHPARLHTFASMGLTCFSFAHAVGADPIVLLGIDCGNSSGGHTNFYGNNPWQAESNYATWTRYCHWIEKHSSRHIINCGWVPCFQPLSFTKCLDLVKAL